MGDSHHYQVTHQTSLFPFVDATDVRWANHLLSGQINLTIPLFVYTISS